MTNADQQEQQGHAFHFVPDESGYAMADQQERWRYEVRGSSLYDLTERRPLSIFEAGEILNAHQALLIKEGIWAARAGLAQGRVDALERQLSTATEALQAMPDLARRHGFRYERFKNAALKAAAEALKQLEQEQQA